MNDSSTKKLCAQQATLNGEVETAAAIDNTVDKSLLTLRHLN